MRRIMTYIYISKQPWKILLTYLKSDLCLFLFCGQTDHLNINVGATKMKKITVIHI